MTFEWPQISRIKFKNPFDEMRLQSKCSKISHNYKLSHLEDEYMYDFCWYAKKNKNKIKIREVDG